MQQRSGYRLRVGHIAGIAVDLDWSLLIIFTLITVALAVGLFPAWHPEWSAATAWLAGLGAATLFLMSVLAHEFAHALVGRRRCLSTKMSRPLSYAALADDGLSACKSFGGFSQTLSALLQFRIGPDQRRGCAALAVS